MVLYSSNREHAPTVVINHETGGAWLSIVLVETMF